MLDHPQIRDLLARAYRGQTLPLDETITLLEQVDDVLHEASSVDLADVCDELKEHERDVEAKAEALVDLRSDLAAAREEAAGLRVERDAARVESDARERQLKSATEEARAPLLDRIDWLLGEVERLKRSNVVHLVPRPSAARQTGSLASPRVGQVLAMASGSARDLFRQADAIDEDPALQHRAIHLYREALAIDPEFAEAWTNLGNCLVRLGQSDEAMRSYFRALAIDGVQREALYNMGYLHLDAGRIGDAIGWFRDAIAADETYADAHFNLAHALERRGGAGDARTARKHWRRFLELEPDGEAADVARAPERTLPRGDARSRAPRSFRTSSWAKGREPRSRLPPA